MPDIRSNFKTPGLFRFLASLLIFSLALPPLGYAQQPQTPQQRILTPENPKTSADKASPSEPREARPELVLQTGVTAPAYEAVFSPDGRLLASMDFMAGSIKLWEVASWRELCAINLGARAAATYAFNSAFAFSADGSSLFSVSAGTLKQWDTRSGRQLRAADLNQGKDFGSAYFSADARLLATATETRSSLAMWDVVSGRKLQELKLDGENGGQLVAFALSHDGQTLATNIKSDSGNRRSDMLTLRDAASGRVIQTIEISEQKQKLTMAMAMSSAYTSPARAVRFSPDGRAVAVAFHDTTRENPQVFSGGQGRVTGQMNKIRMWDVSGGRELISLDAGAPSSGAVDSIFDFGMTNTLALSNDNRQCAVASGNMIKLLDLATRRILATIIGHTGEVIAVNFSADGKSLATTSLDSTIKIWDVSMSAVTGRAELARTLSGMATPIESAAFSGDGRALAVSGATAVNVWELNTGAALRTITRPAVALDKDSLNHPAPGVFSAGGRLIAAQSGENEIKLWETRTGREVKSFPLSEGKKFGGGGVSPDGKWVALAERQPDSQSASRATNPTPNSSGSPASPTQPNAPQSAQGFPQFPPTTIPTAPPDPTGNSKQDEKASKKEAKEQMKELKKRQEEMLGQMMGGKKMDRSQMKKMGEQAQKNAEQMREVMESGDIGKAMEMIGNAIPGMPGTAAASQPRVNVKLWDVNAVSEPRSLPSKPSLLGNRNGSVFAFNNDGSLLASATGGPSFKINEVSSGRELFTLSLPRSFWVDSLAWSADGRLLASSQPETRASVNFTSLDSIESYSGLFSPSIKLWDAATGRELRTMTGHAANVRVTAFSPDSRLLASAGEDAVVKLWDTATGREIMTLNGHSQTVKALAFSDDGKLLVSGGDDGGARLWDVNTGEALATLITLNSGADWLVVTPDGLFDGTPGAWGQILWRFSPDNIFDVAPVEIFFNDFFYPGLLADIASGKRPKAALNVERKDRREPILRLARADNATGRTIKLKIEVSEPDTANQATGAGARDLRLFRNGTLVKVWRGDALNGQKQGAFEAEIPIVAGENRLLAYAFNRDGVKSSDAVLTVTGDESLRRKGVAYVIACGVNQYANPQYNLKYAGADATSFAEELRAQQMKLQDYERVEVIPLLDREATKANFLLALNRLSTAPTALPAGAAPALSKIQPAQPEDAVFIFFAGHGAAQGSRFYLIPHDLGYAGARDALTAEAVKTILSHGVSDLELEAAIEGVDAGQMLFVLDACNSGQALEAEEKRRGPMNSSGLAQLAYEKGMYILTAAQSYQAALEAAELGHGYLTFALIEDGLKKGLADRDPKDGLALAREWFNYAEERVPQMQEREMRTRLLLDFAVNEAKSKDPKQRDIQRPRVFYRRELEAHPFIVAKP